MNLTQMKISAVLAALLMCRLLATGQETNTPPQTNLTVLSEAPAQTNALTEMTEPVQTNVVGETTGSVPTNAVAETIPTALTNAPAPASAALPTSEPSRLDYSAFRIIAERNIFDPNRSPRSRFSRTRRPGAPRITDSFSLVGTMSYEKGTFAFFDGTSFDYRKVLQCEGQIAGYKIADIGQNNVKLQHNTNTIELRVGAQMRREEDGAWTLSAYGETAPMAAMDTSPSAATSAVSSATTETAASQPASSGATEDTSEVLKRLMQKREQELK